MKRLILLLLILQLSLGPLVPAQAAPMPQTGTAARLLARLTTEEKIGQLLLVTFYGSTIEPGSEIERLIAQYRIGGVAIVAANDNITETVSAPEQVLTLANRLQALNAIPTQNTSVEPDAAPPYIPLFIALQQEGDGYPFSEIRSGLTEMPNAMALGATWDEARAQAMGEVAGQELSAIGVNLLLGPALDVLENPRTSGGDLGTRVLGGDPFWVGKLGRGYIRGVHLGSQNQIAVIAKSFPGLGAIDRDPTDEVPTVRKSVEELTRIDLLPFFMVTGSAPEPAAMADGVMTAHLQFQGLQGNIRQTTDPFTFDKRTNDELMALPELATWRTSGGLTVSGPLGVRALKRYFDRDYLPREVALNAFNAGSDVLFLSEFGQNPPQDQTRNVIDTLNAFVQRYSVDAEFAQRVDAAVTRVLTLKLKLYGGAFEPERTQLPLLEATALAQQRARVLEVAQSAASLISPSRDELDVRAPQPPSRTERIVFITEIQVGRQCSTCVIFPVLGQTAVQDAVLRLYGPDGSARLNPRNLQSFTVEELVAYLSQRANPPPTPEPNTPTPEPLPISSALEQADWIVFATTSSAGSVNGVSAFLSQRPDLARSKKVIGLAFHAPHYLDTTSLSKLTAYYALYSKSEPFVEVAARLLMRDVVPQGRSPITVESAGYRIAEVVSPQLGQVISIEYAEVPFATTALTGTATPTTQPPSFKLGDTLYLRTSVIVDRNGYTVPDGTPVQFTVLFQADTVRDTRTIETVTKDGLALASVPLDRNGVLGISVASGTVISPFRLELSVRQDVDTGVTPIPPTNTPTATPTITPTPEPQTPTPTATPTPTTRGRVTGGDFLFLIVGVMLALVAGWQIGGGAAQLRRAVRVALLGAVGALIGYNVFALDFPGMMWLATYLSGLAPALCVLVGAGLGLALGWWWARRSA
ncbi:MAG: hypothetical protein JNL09_02600 [Anaerolineales bacterium]|nr:hypothetical protein [Anaerolineales bacterium]